MTAPLRVDGVPRRGQRSLRVANDGHRRRRVGPRLRDDRRLGRLRLPLGPDPGLSLGLSLESRRRLRLEPRRSDPLGPFCRVEVKSEVSKCDEMQKKKR